MKNLAFTTLVLSAIVSTAFAGGPKTSILHCGAELVSGNMVYTAISVSNNSKGHGKNHLVGSVDSEATGNYDETTGEEIYVDFIRVGDDCLLEGEADDLGIEALCAGEQVEGAVCGMQVI